MTQKWHLILFAFLIFSCQQPVFRPPNSLEGVWKVIHIRSVWGGNENVNAAPQPGLAIFTKRHYSMVWIPTAQSRKPSAKRWFPTDGEKIHDFNTVIVNSGTYGLKDSILTTYPVVAKTPEFMGGWAAFNCRVSGDSLWLTGTDIFSCDNVRDPGVDQVRTTIQFVRVE